jgi:hypothetical protein
MSVNKTIAEQYIYKKWAAECKRGRTSLEVDPREGRPISATTPEVNEQVHDMILDDRRMKVC